VRNSGSFRPKARYSPDEILDRRRLHCLRCSRHELQEAVVSEFVRRTVANKGYDLIEELKLVEICPPYCGRGGRVATRPIMPRGRIRHHSRELASLACKINDRRPSLSWTVCSEWRRTLLGRRFLNSTVAYSALRQRMVNRGRGCAPGARPGLGRPGFDDEGVPRARCTPIITMDCSITGPSVRAKTAHTIGENRSGEPSARRMDRLPMIRMTNISLLPGKSR